MFLVIVHNPHNLKLSCATIKKNPGGKRKMSEIFASKTPEVEEREVLHANLSRELAGECMVLLENDGALPFAAKQVAIY